MSEFSTRTSTPSAVFTAALLTEVADQPDAVGHPAAVPPGERGGDVVVAQVAVVGVDIAIAVLDVSFAGVGEAGDAEDLGVVVAVGNGGGRHLVEAGEEGEVRSC